MMRRVIVSVIVVAVLGVAVYAAVGTFTPGLVVSDVGWKEGWPDPCPPNPNPFRDFAVADYYPVGKLRNQTTQNYECVLITCSVFDAKTKEKLQVKPMALIENVRSGDKCQWQAYPGVERPVGGNVGCYIRIDSIEGCNLRPLLRKDRRSQ